MYGKLLEYGRSAGIYFAASLIPMAVMALLNPLIAMNMSPEDYAVTGYYGSFSALFTPLIIFYFINYYNKRFYETSPEERLKVRAMLFKALIFFSFGVSVLCFVCLACYQTVFRHESGFPVLPYGLMAVSAIPLTGIYRLEQAECRMGRDARGYFAITVAAGIMLAAANVVFVVAAGWGASGKLLAPLAANLTMFVYLAVKHRKLFRVKTDMGEFSRVLKFCLPLTAGAMLGYFFNGFDRTYLESLGDTEEYGNYIVGAQIAGYLGTLSAAVTSVFQPDIYEAVARKDGRMLARTFVLQTGSIGAVVLVFIIFCPLIVSLLTAGRYADAAPYARIIAVSTLTSSVYFIVNNCTIAGGHPRIYLWTTIAGSIFTVLAYPFATRMYGYVGGAFLVGFSFVVLAAINVILLAAVRMLRRDS